MKNDKGWPISLKTFRLTSTDRGAVVQAAETYGGEVKPWQNGKNQEWEVITESSSMDVILPPDCVSGPIWEYWNGKSMKFSCTGYDGVCDEHVPGPDGAEIVEKDCQCQVHGKRVCKSKTRLSVLLPDVALGGVWLLTTTSIHAAVELQTMVNLVQMSYAQTLTPARLALEPRVSTSGGKTKHFNVPVLRTQSTIMELQASAQAFGIPAGDNHIGAIEGELIE